MAAERQADGRLASFRVEGSVLNIDLAHIDGGGEGALPAIAALAVRYALRRGLLQIEWLVRATNCARPNAKLRRVLERRGFQVREVPGRGECYFQSVRRNIMFRHLLMHEMLHAYRIDELMLKKDWE